MAGLNTLQVYKDAAMDFLTLVVAGRIDEAYQKHVDMQGWHHNVYYPSDFTSLKQGMMDNHAQFPLKQINIKHVIAEDSLVAVHSNIVMSPGETGVAVVHLFRFAGDRIAEMWDIGQLIPIDSPNMAGAF